MDCVRFERMKRKIAAIKNISPVLGNAELKEYKKCYLFVKKNIGDPIILITSVMEINLGNNYRSGKNYAIF